MTKKAHRFGSRVVLPALLLSFGTATAFAQDDDLFVQDSSGAGVRDSAGDCVLSISGAVLTDCVEAPVAVVVAPTPPPTVSQISPSADAFFDFDESTLKPEGRAELSSLASQLASADVQSVDIVGHTDSIGTEAYNQALSERRAQSAADYLIGQGINPGVVSTRGAGESQPVAPNTNPDGSDNPAGRAQNRRVDITVIAQTTQ